MNFSHPNILTKFSFLCNIFDVFFVANHFDEFFFLSFQDFDVFFVPNVPNHFDEFLLLISDSVSPVALPWLSPLSNWSKW